MYLYERLAKQREQDKKEQAFWAPPPLPQEDKRYVALMGSVSHTYGNALAFIQDWIINLFPENMFKTIHVNSKIAHRQIKSTTHEYLKKSKPMILFRPRIPGPDEDRFLKGTPLIERQTDMYSQWGATNLQPFFHDPEHDLTIKYQMNRMVFYVDVVLVFSTLMLREDYFHYFYNSVRINHPFNLDTCFESYLPQEMLKILSDCVDVPLYDSDMSTKPFLDYMNAHSSYPITFKLQGSTQTKEFYRYYPVIIDTEISNLDKDDGEQSGHTMTNYQMSFTVRMAFNATGFYYIFSDKLHHINLPKIDPEDSSMIPLYTDVLLPEDLDLPYGWSLYNRGTCRLEKEEDSVNFNQMLNMSIREAIAYHKKNGLPMVSFIDIKIRRQGKPIHEFQDYTIDWDKLEIHFKHGDTFHTYNILICLNITYINTLMKDLYNLK